MRQRPEPTKILRRVGHGRPPKELRHTEEGLLDLRELRLSPVRKAGVLSAGGAEYSYSRSKPILKGLDLTDVDLTNAILDDSYWADCSLLRVRLDGASCKGLNFDSSNTESVSFIRTDLRDAHWGSAGVDGPIISKGDFVNADLRGTTYGHPLFRDCGFVNCNLKDVRFGGARFERCTFVGLLDGVWFKGWQKDPNPKTTVLRNSMEGVDFSRADLRFVGFTHGIDLTRSKLPNEGYVRIPHPQETYAKVLERIRTLPAGKAREAAEFYVSGRLEGHFGEDQPFDLLRPEDLLESPMGREAAMGVIQAVREVLAAGPA